MATTTPSHPLPPLRPFVNGVRDRNVRFPRIGELVLIRLPFDISGPASIISGSAGYSYHPCIVLGVFVRAYTWEMNVYVCCTYGGEPDAVSYVSSLLPTDRNRLLPLPSHLPLYTPPGFGAPLSFRNVLWHKPGWLVINSVMVDMGRNSPYKPFQPQGVLPSAEVYRIRVYKSLLVAASIASTTLLPPGLGDTGGAGAGATGAGAGGAGVGGAHDTT
ncbi:hypothetical protein Q9L58_000528 [Maublancomyces gigas]|uniref:Uncharacterized protein n=1 Tax=Discina gigas TaxID=1032678 RepID=A0ABR3GWB4_9PEZI